MGKEVPAKARENLGLWGFRGKLLVSHMELLFLGFFPGTIRSLTFFCNFNLVFYVIKFNIVVLFGLCRLLA